MAEGAGRPKFGDGLCFRGFSWHTNDPKLLERARPEIEKFLASNWRKANHGEGMQWLSDGVYLPWNIPGSYATGYGFYRSKLGGLAPRRGNSLAWRVVGHAIGYAAAEAASHAAPGEAHANPTPAAGAAAGGAPPRKK